MDHNGPAEQLNQFFGRSKKNFQNFFYYIKFEKKIVRRVENFRGEPQSARRTFWQQRSRNENGACNNATESNQRNDIFSIAKPRKSFRGVRE